MKIQYDRIGALPAFSQKTVSVRKMQGFPLFSRKIHNDRRAFMKELFEALLAALRRGETAALCTILGASGSAPRGAGAQMAAVPLNSEPLRWQKRQF